MSGFEQISRILTSQVIQAYMLKIQIVLQVYVTYNVIHFWNVNQNNFCPEIYQH